MAESKTPDNVEFKLLEYKCIGNDTVVFELEDGAKVKIKVDIDKIGIASNFKNPDGTPHYLVNPTIRVNVIPADKMFRIPRSQVRVQQSRPHSKPPDHMIT
jgi:hypothetical protein